MPRLRCPKWTAALSVGNDEIDGEHQAFLTLVERVSRLIEHGTRSEIMDASTAMVALLNVHFVTEERIFGETPYPDAAAHRVEHRVLLHMAIHAKKMIDRVEDVGFIRLSLRYLAQSLVEHLLETDMGYRCYLRKPEI